MSPVIDDVLLKASEAAGVLKVSRAHVASLVRRGVLPKVSIGSREYRIPRSALLAWIKANTHGDIYAQR